MRSGLFMSNQGYEYGLVLLAASAALAIAGAGKGSIDQVLAQAHRNRPGS
jgi:putative oxidoreductase